MHPKHPGKKPLTMPPPALPSSSGLGIRLPPRLTDGMSLGRLVAEARGHRSIRDLAAELQESHATLHKVEKGQMPKVHLWLKLLVWLNVLDRQIADRLMEYAE